MPIYEYRCQDCGTRFEKLVRNSAAEAELACPSCGENRLQQELSTFSAHAGGHSKSAELPPCANRCSNPGACGMNFN